MIYPIKIKNIYKYIFGLAIILLCLSFAFNKNKDIKYIKHGSSFGMCHGYCINECKIDSLRKITERTAWQKDKYPKKVKTEAITKEEWNTLIHSINLEEFNKLPNKIGCPDCLDGGAEWIEIKYSNKVKKVTFEYGQDIKGISELLKQLRKNN